MQEKLEKIKAFADHAHGGQKRKYNPERYIEHPVRVMNTCKRFTDDIAVLAAALLHDVLEDTSVTEEELHLFLLDLLGRQEAIRTLNLVRNLTDVYIKKNYPHLNRATRKAKEFERLSTADPLSQSIKYADVIDNSVGIAKQDADFANVSLREYKELLSRLDKGDARLRSEAMQVVEQERHVLKKR